MDDPGLIILAPRFAASLHDNLLGKIAASLLVPVLRVSSSLKHPLISCPSSLAFCHCLGYASQPLHSLKRWGSWSYKHLPGQNIESGMEDSEVSGWPQENYFKTEGFTRGLTHRTLRANLPFLRAFPLPGRLPRGSLEQSTSQEARKGVLGNIQRPTMWG